MAGRCPSLKTIRERLGVDADQAARIRGLMDGTRKTMQYESVKGWVAKCHNMPPRQERVMEALNEELDGFGVEEIEDERRHDSYYGGCVATYLNMGDTYDTTIIYNTQSGSYSITCWGDWLETYERRHGRVV